MSFVVFPILFFEHVSFYKHKSLLSTIVPLEKPLQFCKKIIRNPTVKHGVDRQPLETKLVDVDSWSLFRFFPYD